ncbi:esterase [Sulfurimonas sp. SAG-AH-194-L11]|nr:YqiA/YcfP family alpha/beta fold hydrolase [Sulfurimonas sp. SAG-AH-194-L11]MDF1877090.1 esterase [Sulfurimonas sp. SAG-AH-194-L11]
MIIYIHGFASSGQGTKATLFRAYFKSQGVEFIAPSLSTIPSLALDTLQQLIESYIQLNQKVSLMGSSLGGFYSIYLSQKYNLKAVLINPSIFPYDTLSHVPSPMTNFYDGASFEWRQKHYEALREYEVTGVNEENFMLLLQTGDESLDYRHAARKFKNASLNIEEGGSHSYEDIESKFKNVEKFLVEE